MTSEKMNQLMHWRNERSSWALYRPRCDSSMTLPNQPNSVTTSSAMPAANTQGPLRASGWSSWLIQVAPP